MTSCLCVCVRACAWQNEYYRELKRLTAALPLGTTIILPTVYFSE
jgi:hypothetical protein